MAIELLSQGDYYAARTKGGSSDSVVITIPNSVVDELGLEGDEYPEIISFDPETRSVVFTFGDEGGEPPEAVLSLPEQLQKMDPDTLLADD